MKTQLILDVECYKNYFLIMLFNPAKDSFVWFETQPFGDLMASSATIRRILESAEIVTFNGNNYDIPLVSAALRGSNTSEIRFISDLIIKDEMKPWKLEKTYGPHIPLDHIDLIEVAPGQASLKIYGGRLCCPKLQDLPVDPEALLTLDQMLTLREYCKNDVRTTAALLQKLTPQINLRREMSQKYGVDLRSKSDAQIAEAVIVKEIEKLRPIPKTPSHTGTFLYQPPEFLTGHIRPEILTALENPFTVKTNGVTEMPKQLEELKITIGGTTYQLGMGGLHSTEKKVNHHSDAHTILADHDVASYYPSIILRCGLYPPHLGVDFLDVYRKIVEQRLSAKKLKDNVTADTLKIVVNGSFGKLGSKYSKLYAPHLMVQVTVTGQLSLLMLIEWLESKGISVVSGNTDGVVIKCPKTKETTMTAIVRLWERLTGFEMERNDYKALYSRDVNNYVAIKEDGKIKTKGCYSFAGLMKNPQNEICNIAVIEYLKEQTPVRQTISQCKDITKFLTIRKVKGGAVYDGQELGKAVRWYYNGSDKFIAYKTNGNKVAKSDGSVPIMDLPDEFPTDIDYDWYINETYELLSDVGLK